MKQLTVEQRYGINLMLQQGKSQKAISEAIGVHKSTISRELKRNCDNRSGEYNYDLAQRKYAMRKKEKRRKEVFTSDLKIEVESLLKKAYSPEQITGRLHMENKVMVSHETIYRWIWKDKRAKGTLHLYLRRQGRKYAKRGSSSNGRGMIPERVDIEQRPAIVDEKQRFGDLEIDTIIGKNHKGAIVTINDRATSKVWIRKLTGKEAIPLANKTIDA